MHETTSYEVVAGVVEDEVKDEEKQIDVTGVEVALPPPPPPVDEPAATPFDEEETTPQAIDEPPPNPFDRPFDEPTTPTAPLAQLTEVPTPCRRASRVVVSRTRSASRGRWRRRADRFLARVGQACPSRRRSPARSLQRRG